MVSKAADEPSNTKALGLPLDNDFHILSREELSLLRDQLYMLTSTGYLS